MWKDCFGARSRSFIFNNNLQKKYVDSSIYVLILTENLHCEEETCASSHVGDHTAVLATVLRRDFLDLQVLTSCQPLDTPTQLI